MLITLCQPLPPPFLSPSFPWPWQLIYLLPMNQPTCGCGQETGTHSESQEQLSLGDRIVKFIGWMGGFYSRKSVNANVYAVVYLQHVCTFITEQPQSNVQCWLSVQIMTSAITHYPEHVCSHIYSSVHVYVHAAKILYHMLLYWQVLSRSALEIYKSCIDQLDYEAFFRGAVATAAHPLITLVISLSSNAIACSMPDILQSWFLVAQLHIWLCLVRLKREGKDGAYVTRQVVSTFWFDVKERTKALGVSWLSYTASTIHCVFFRGGSLSHTHSLTHTHTHVVYI